MFKDLPKDKVVNKSFKNIGAFTMIHDFSLLTSIQCVVSHSWNWLAISEWKLSESKSNTLFLME